MYNETFSGEKKKKHNALLQYIRDREYVTRKTSLRSHRFLEIRGRRLFIIQRGRQYAREKSPLRSLVMDDTFVEVIIRCVLSV